MTEAQILETILQQLIPTVHEGKEVGILKSPNQLAHELKVLFDNHLGKTLLEANFKNY
jgi:hypothetical protein